MKKYNAIKNDFSDFAEIIKNPNHVVRRYYSAFMNGDYGKEYFDKYSERLHDAFVPHNRKKIRSIIIQSFCEYNSVDYGLTSSEVQRWLIKNIGKNKLERLNLELEKDLTDLTSEGTHVFRSWYELEGGK